MSVPELFDHLHSGKVRDLYRSPENLLLMVATDRISAFDHVLPTEIPDKGRVLTAMTHWWFERLADIVPNHMIAVDDVRIPDQWRGRAMLCRWLTMVPVEAVARGYLAGSGWIDYETTGAICAVPLPAGLIEGDILPEPIFTPATKAAPGAHDENISFDDIAAQIGADMATRIGAVTLQIYRRAAEISAGRGLILADTKFEFGTDEFDRLTIGDEVLTPDSSRFWPADQWKPGHAQPSYDKQFVRDWLTSPASGWDRGSGAPPPPLPDDVVVATRARYIQAYERLTGLNFADWLAPTGR